MKKKQWLAIGLILFSTSLSYAQEVKPIKASGSRYAFSYKPLELLVDTLNGARIVSLRYNDIEILYLNSSQDMNGSTFWPSPQSLWGWPPPANIDNKAYKAKIVANKLVLTSNIEPSLHIRVSKTIALNASDTSAMITYSIKNEGTRTIKLAPWEITRVPLEGPIVFPLENGLVSGSLATETFKTDAYVWYNQQNTKTTGAKFFANGKGWIAYISATYKLIFLKKFQDIASNQAAPSEAEVEVYTASDHSYSEIENQGKYTSLPPKDSLSYIVIWIVRQVPDTILIESGNQKLAEFIDSLSQQFSIPQSEPTSIPWQPKADDQRKVYYNNGQLKLIGFKPTEFPINLTISDVLGRIVMQKNINQSVSTTSILPSGVYILKVTDRYQKTINQKSVVH